MKNRKRAISVFLLLMLLVSVRSLAAVVTDTKTWTSVWSTSMIDATVKDVIEYKKGFIISSVVNMRNNTARMALKVNGSGEKLRLVLSNDFGEANQPIKSISVGKTDTSNTRLIQKNTRKQVYYKANKSFSIPAGQRITTDAIDMSVSAGEMITVSIYYGDREPDTIGLYGADAYTHIIGANYAERDDFGTLKGEQLYSDDSKATGHYDLIPSLCEVDVYGDQMDGCVVIFGDSTVTNEIPNYLAENLRANGITNLSVTQAAIKGNRLIRDGVEDSDTQGNFIGISALKRFKKDVLDQANVKYVIVKIGDNDIVHPYCSDMHSPVADIEDMKDAFREINILCKENGIQNYVCEIAPWKNYTRENTVQWSKEIDQLRLNLNEWILKEHSANCIFPMDCITDGYAVKAEDTTDGAHYTDHAQRKLAKLFQCVFTKELVDFN